MADVSARQPPTSSARRAHTNHPRTESVPGGTSPKRLTADQIRQRLRAMSITEEVFIHEQDYEQFLEDKGIKELGRGGEGAVYFLRGHVVKVVNIENAPATLREIAHMLHLNRIVKGGAMGERGRPDFPALLWVYTLSNGSLSIGMKPFDLDENAPPGATLYERLYFGPTMERDHALRTIRAIAQSLVYAERQGIIHHDLKPANLYVPGNPAQNAVVFDLGQALWRQSAWGKVWLRHEHNFHYWYNGTFRYMHYQRRLAHLAALASAYGQAQTQKQEAALNSYVPCFYDDVFAYARILRDFVRSKNTYLHPKDKMALRAFYQRIMGLQHKPKPQPTPPPKHESALVKRFATLFAPKPPPPPPPEPPTHHRWGSMETVLAELEKVLAALAP